MLACDFGHVEGKEKRVTKKEKKKDAPGDVIVSSVRKDGDRETFWSVFRSERGDAVRDGGAGVNQPSAKLSHANLALRR